jgi:two-component sensor histidine kinase
MITTSVPNWYVDDTEERELFEEVAGDISYALYNCERERERKKAEDEVKKELQEKEVLLREIHHRVKNNLNIVSSLLSLQSDQIETVPQAKEAFRKSRTRIHSMALVHNNLYRKETLSHVGLPFYIETLIADVSGIYDSEHHIHIDTDIEDLTLNIDLALPVGLIVNELVTNALKYAFPQEKKGEVAVSLHPVNNTDCQLRVKDNGVGLPADVDIHSSETLGLQLVNVLAEQLGGTLELKNELGTELILEFPLIK